MTDIWINKDCIEIESVICNIYIWNRCTFFLQKMKLFLSIYSFIFCPHNQPISSRPLHRDGNEGNPTAASAVSPFANNSSGLNTSSDPCYCYLWKMPKPLAQGY